MGAERHGGFGAISSKGICKRSVLTEIRQQKSEVAKKGEEEK